MATRQEALDQFDSSVRKVIESGIAVSAWRILEDDNVRFVPDDLIDALVEVGITARHYFSDRWCRFEPRTLEFLCSRLRQDTQLKLLEFIIAGKSFEDLIDAVSIEFWKPYRSLIDGRLMDQKYWDNRQFRQGTSKSDITFDTLTSLTKIYESDSDLGKVLRMVLKRVGY